MKRKESKSAKSVFNTFNEELSDQVLLEGMQISFGCSPKSSKKFNSRDNHTDIEEQLRALESRCA